MKILVTGGSGLVGTSLRNIIDTNNKNYTFISSKDYDFKSYEETLECFDKYKPDIVVHLAAIAYSGNSSNEMQYESLINNSRININIFDACRKFNIKKIITSLSIVLSKKFNNIDIESILDGPSLDTDFHQGYVHSKRLLHILAHSYQKSNKGNVIILVPINIYGYSNINNSNQFIPHIIRQCKSNKPIDLSKESFRQLLYADDMSKIIEKFINLDEEKFIEASENTYIIGNPEILTTEQIIKTICLKLNIKFDPSIFGKNYFSRNVKISPLPFKFEYTNFKTALDIICDKNANIYSSIASTNH